MKKLLAVLLAALLLAAPAFAQTASLAGEWTMTKTVASGVVMSPEAYGLSMTIVLNPDGTAFARQTINGAPMEENGTWTQAGNTVTITSQLTGEVSTFTLQADGTLLAMAGLRYRWHAAAAVENRLANLTVRGGMWILDHVERRMAKAHPALTFVRPKRQQTDTFAAGCSPYKIILLFFIGAFLGDITETIFCRVTGGEWMSRSSVVWGPFSIVWGLAIAMVTQLLYRYKDKPASWLFVMGTLLGGAYEYLCSVFTEVVFGAVFWDYSAIPFNLGGRINLLYCFFWGFAAIAWFKVLFPPISACIEKLPPRGGRVLTWALCIFMAADIAVSSAALVRYNDRLNGVPASNSVEVYLDEHYGNDRMYQVYPKAVHTS